MLARAHNSWSEHVANGEAYSAEDFILASPGLYPHLQLFNPIGSGKRIRVRKVHETMTVLRSVNVRRYDPPGTILGPPATFIIENLLSGGPPAVAELRHDNIIIPSGGAFWLVRSNANEAGTYPPKGQEPFRFSYMSMYQNANFNYILDFKLS